MSPGEGSGWEERVVVRRFRAADLQHIIPIENATLPVDAFPESQFRRLSTTRPDEFFVAEISGTVVGYVAGSVTGRYAARLAMAAIQPISPCAP